MGPTPPVPPDGAVVAGDGAPVVGKVVDTCELDVFPPLAGAGIGITGGTTGPDVPSLPDLGDSSFSPHVGS
jgi:hypothetical protein